MVRSPATTKGQYYTPNERSLSVIQVNTPGEVSLQAFLYVYRPLILASADYVIQVYSSSYPVRIPSTTFCYPNPLKYVACIPLDRRILTENMENQSQIIIYDWFSMCMWIWGLLL
jgi:hypothetical protein